MENGADGTRSVKFLFGVNVLKNDSRDEEIMRREGQRDVTNQSERTTGRKKNRKNS